MHLRRNLSALVGICLLSTGCSWFSWLPWVDKKVDPDAPAELTSYKAEVKIDRIWGGSIGAGLGKQFVHMPPGVLADRVFAADGFGYVEGRERFKGKKLWSHRIGPSGKGFFSFLNPFDRKDTSYVTGGVGAGEGLVILGTTHAEVIALSAADGSEKWRVRVSSEVLSTPVTGEGLVFVQTSDGRLLALDAQDGSRRWTFDTQVPVLTLRGTGAPVYWSGLGSGLVIAGFANGKVSAFRASTGEPVWDQRVMLPQGRSELDRIVDIDGAPVVTPTAVYAATFQGRISALRPSDGTQLWERDTSTYVDLAVGYGNVYVVDDKSIITAIDQRTSTVAWEQKALFKRGLTAVAVVGNYLIVGDDDGFVHVLAQSDGRLVGRRKLDGDGIRSRCVVAEDIAYCMGNGGSFAALQIKPVKS
jgi:outer membrane protein assembly factor BamB